MWNQLFQCATAILCQTHDVKWQVLAAQPAEGGRKVAQSTAVILRSTLVTWSHPCPLFCYGLLGQSQGWQVLFMRWYNTIHPGEYCLQLGWFSGFQQGCFCEKHTLWQGHNCWNLTFFVQQFSCILHFSRLLLISLNVNIYSLPFWKCY